MTLEEELADLRARVGTLAERVRVHRVAESFTGGSGPDAIADGDYFVEYGTPYRVSIGSDGRWTYGSTEYFNRPRDVERLYTRAEVEAVSVIRLSALSDRIRALAAAIGGDCECRSYEADVLSLLEEQ